MTGNGLQSAGRSGRGASAGEDGRGLSAETEERIAAEVRKYPRPRTALLPALKIAQREADLLTTAVIGRVAELVGVSHASANELATFYSMLHKEPLGHTVVEVCCQLPCALRGADELLNRLSQTLGVAPGQTTANGAATLLRSHECFGACHRAPMCIVNHEYREHLTGHDLQVFLEEMRALAASPRSQVASPRPASEVASQ